MLLDLSKTCLHVQRVRHEVLDSGPGSCRSVGAVQARCVPGGDEEKTWQHC